ncbi:acyl-CoA dehydrogenase family protein [Kocuria atrinae]|uniref:acyl-CoA dehydrogenase family protein n=1 Tax=Kocuria atrinae TaxID=592377 RepID=UPI000307D310|nr:acyl-CoA dehydrogenase family protein [Kocuria atrinae]
MNADKVQAFLGAVSDKGLEAAETGTPGILDDFRSSGLGGMLIPAGLGGLGMSALDAVQFVMRLGAIAPSAAIATVMHNFSVAGSWLPGNMVRMLWNLCCGELRATGCWFQADSRNWDKEGSSPGHR